MLLQEVRTGGAAGRSLREVRRLHRLVGDAAVDDGYSTNAM
jgi:hypothetical protein